VIAPEGANSILWRGARSGADAARAMKISAQELFEMKIVDRIIPEPVGGAHSDRAQSMANVAEVLEEELAALDGLAADELKNRRAERFYAIGRTLQ
jgi:acetyl-CoA carboxylase carboxyl transferase subunit alpha